MKAILVTDQAAGTARMKVAERPEPQAAINDVVVQVHASGFTSGELTWPSTWTDRLDRERTTKHIGAPMSFRPITKSVHTYLVDYPVAIVLIAAPFA